jgi:hypothetical protein
LACLSSWHKWVKCRLRRLCTLNITCLSVVVGNWRERGITIDDSSRVRQLTHRGLQYLGDDFMLHKMWRKYMKFKSTWKWRHNFTYGIVLYTIRIIKHPRPHSHQLYAIDNQKYNRVFCVSSNVKYNYHVKPRTKHVIWEEKICVLMYQVLPNN